MLVVGSGVLGTVRAASAEQASMDISPATGPCDATVTITLDGITPNSETPIDIARPSSDETLGRVGFISVDASGHGEQMVTLGAPGCQAAALDDRLGGSQPGHVAQIHLYTGFNPDTLSVQTRTTYGYTTTQTDSGRLPAVGSGDAQIGQHSILRRWPSSPA